MNSPDETFTLISAGKVQGTPVLSAEGETLGEIYDVMLEKRSGKIAYALMSFGGILGIGTKYHPLPWHALKYVPDAGGYVVGIPREALRSGPTLDDTNAWDRRLTETIDGYYQEWPRHSDVIEGAGIRCNDASPRRGRRIRENPLSVFNSYRGDGG
ncbi:PRC-barrel domain protein (modular protein) [Hyphomicrobium sp. GJ21]|uniref:PRC-barrel domain-containing protein n=1 Tax=Hyphomicrobium sp. GJ21 TaxID=113574 RepID=UPI000622BAC6|nr:PRC-barrel domain-containing protein [Hyphomicrobium sp. GJ21]CEJ86877.1 PRC-barrel domain protein (modular protein) [Hyphomicrobium sp. GJ21]